MKIIVCVKQVPEISEVRINPETGTLIREGVQSILNPFCEYGLDEAINIRRSLLAEGERVEIVAITMGPPQAREALLRCIELGADRATLLSDRKFAGADTWATALTISEAIKQEGDFDLIIAGKQAIDGDTAQVGPEIAEFLGMPQICYGVSTEVDLKRRRIKVRKEGEKGLETAECHLPAVITMTKGAPSRRLPSFAELVDARSKPINMLTADDLGGNPDRFGLIGSLTQVAKIFPPRTKSGGQIIDGSDPDTAVDRLLNFLITRKFLTKEA
ncbi:MAG: electron transfer flavoprotein subunit beta/FixA family protein [Candidatus Odinarchaeota archaeon]